MTLIVVLICAAAGCLAAGLAAGRWLLPRARPSHEKHKPAVGTILLPFTGQAISRRAFEAAVRLAQAEHATIVPVFLACVPLHLSLDAPVPKQCEIGMPLLEAIEQRARSQGVDVDARVSRGRSYPASRPPS